MLRRRPDVQHREAVDRTVEDLVVTDRGDSRYRLDLLVARSATLADLDRYLRETWVDCCGHASLFRDGAAVADALSRQDQARIGPQDAADVFGVYLLGRMPDGGR